MTGEGEPASSAPRAQSKASELLDEFRSVVGARQRALDWLLPPLVFLPLQAWLGLTVAAIATLGLAASLLVWRALCHRPMRYALVGLVGLLVAIGASLVSRGAAGFLLPNMVSSGINAALCLVSVTAKRPLVAWTSHVARGWPLEWYWHPRVRPAYTNTTLAWAAFFALRGAVQAAAYLSGSALWLGLVGVAGGWPATILLLVASYLYGTWRLARLGGPSVHEFEQGAPPPWRGQRRGF
jgi:hypothetical protein